MNERRLCPHHHQQQQKFEDKFRLLEDELKRKTDSNKTLRHEPIPFTSKNDPSHITMEQSVIHNPSQRSSNWNILTKDREIAKLKALIFQKDNELIELTTANKNSLIQMEARMERERKIWNEHKDLLLAGERAKFEEEKTRLHKDLQEQLKFEQERCQRLEQKLYTAQMQSSEAQLTLKESARERINAVYNIKEQCRKEFLDEISRLRNQFQLDRDKEYARLHERIHELEKTSDQLSNENTDLSTRTQEMMLTLEVSEKTCVRSLYDCIKKLLMAMESPSHSYAAIPSVTSFTYERESLIERLPTRNVLKLLQDKIDDVRNYITEQKGQRHTRQKSPDRSKILTDRVSDDTKNRNESTNNSLSKIQKENDFPSLNVDRLCPIEDKHYQSPYKSHHPCQLSSQQNDTIDNLVQKLENHIAFELDRLTKQRLTLNNSNDHDDSSILYSSKQSKKMKSDSICLDTTGEFQHDESSHHHLYDNQQSKLSPHLDISKHHSYSSMYLHKNSTIE